MDSEHDDTFGRTAELAYFCFLAVFPGLVMVMSVIGLITGSNPAFPVTLFRYAARALPPSAWQLLQKTISARRRGGRCSSAWWARAVVGL
jgi:uncharacterized BrkB/YihY/UPF0761 family membrane protein